MQKTGEFNLTKTGAQKLLINTYMHLRADSVLCR